MVTKKIFFTVLSVFFLFLAVGLFTSAGTDAPLDVSNDVPPGLAKKFDNNVGENAYGYVSDFIDKRGIAEKDISKVSVVDFDSLPKEVNLENVGDHNLNIYEVDYKKDSGSEKIFVISYSVEELKAQGDLIIAQDKRQSLNFGYAGEMSDSGFLKTAAGVDTSLLKGYVMARDGSITAVSTNLEVPIGESGDLEVIVYINGEPIGFGNMVSTESSGVKKDYDVMSKDVATFKAGDVVSVYVSVDGNPTWKDVTTLVEITTTD